MIAGLRQYNFCVNAHVWINLFVASVLVISICLSFFFYWKQKQYESLLDYHVNWIKIALEFIWLMNIGIGIAVRHDIRLIRHQEKQSRCTCAYIQAIKNQMFAAQQAQAQAQSMMNQSDQHLQYGSASASASPHCITGPDGSRYVISRPTSSMGIVGGGNGVQQSQPPSPPQEPPQQQRRSSTVDPNNHHHDWIMMCSMGS